MDVQLTPDQKAFAQRAIESGRLHSERDLDEIWYHVAMESGSIEADPSISV